jgi:polyisoprenoid-binding protein YceI
MATTNWIIDASHSEVQFKVKHLVITTVTGSFQEFSGTVASGDTFDNAKITFEANTNSITTHSEQRDGHLKSGDFFDAEKFPKISFTATKFAKKGEDTFELVGDLTIKDVTKSVTLAVEHGGIATDPWGNVKAGFEVTGKINRKDFGLNWNAPTEAGGVLVSEEVKLIANIQLLKQ